MAKKNIRHSKRIEIPKGLMATVKEIRAASMGLVVFTESDMLIRLTSMTGGTPLNNEEVKMAKQAWQSVGTLSLGSQLTVKLGLLPSNQNEKAEISGDQRKKREKYPPGHWDPGRTAILDILATTGSYTTKEIRERLAKRDDLPDGLCEGAVLNGLLTSLLRQKRIEKDVGNTWRFII